MRNLAPRIVRHSQQTPHPTGFLLWNIVNSEQLNQVALSTLLRPMDFVACDEASPVYAALPGL